MRNLTFALASIMALSLIFLGCKKEEVVEYSSNCYISSFSLGSMKRLVHTTTSSGADSTYRVTFTGSYYPFVINQREQTILLKDSLPMGTFVDAVVVSVGFEGVLMHQTWSDQPTDDWVTFDTKDSLDFTMPRRFRVIPTDGEGYRDYFVRLDVRTKEATSFTWDSIPSATPLADRVRMKAIPYFSDAYVLSTDAAGQAYVTVSVSATTVSWTDTPCSGLPANTDVSTLQTFDDAFWVTDSVGQLFRSADCITWSAVTVPTPITLLAASADAIYARTLSGTPVTLSSEDGFTWAALDIDEDATLFPTTSASVAWMQDNGNSRVLIVGTEAPALAEADTACVVWSLLEGFNEPWTYFPEGSAGQFVLPRMKYMSIFPYESWLIAIGSRSEAEGQTAYCYLSQDNGISWKTYSNLTLPAAIRNTASPITAFSSGEYIWVLAGSKVWRARFNSFGED